MNVKLDKNLFSKLLVLSLRKFKPVDCYQWVFPKSYMIIFEQFPLRSSLCRYSSSCLSETVAVFIRLTKNFVIIILG